MNHSLPDGFNTISAHLVVRSAKNAIEFYKRAFGFEETGRLMSDDGTRIDHATLKLGNSTLMLCDEGYESAACLAPPSLEEPQVSLLLYVDNVDALFERAVKAGAAIRMPLADMFWGDRFGKVTDPFGHEWALATHLRDVSESELQTGAAEWSARQQQQQQQQ